MPKDVLRTAVHVKTLSAHSFQWGQFSVQHGCQNRGHNEWHGVLRSLLIRWTSYFYSLPQVIFSLKAHWNTTTQSDYCGCSFKKIYFSWFSKQFCCKKLKVCQPKLWFLSLQKLIKHGVKERKKLCLRQRESTNPSWVSNKHTASKKKKHAALSSRGEWEAER